MENPNDRALAQLQADWPLWQIWTVHQYIGGTAWCARRRDDHSKIINAGNPSELAEYLEDTVSEPIPALDMPMTGAILRDMYPAWTITRNETLGVWQAERAEGTKVHYLAAVEAWELALKIKAAGQAQQ
jgi:hypothetical protein